MDDDSIGTTSSGIAGGELVPVGQLEAIGKVYGRGTCTATLISDNIAEIRRHRSH